MNTYFKTLISVADLQALLAAHHGADPSASLAAQRVPGPPPSLAAPDVTVLDCRFDLANPGAGRDAYRAAHIPGARYVDLNHDLSSPVTPTSGRHPLPDAKILRARLAELGVGANRQTVMYDAANGSIAARAWWLARWLGFDRVAVLDGGLAAWLATGGAVESGEPAAAAPAPASRDAPHTPPAHHAAASERHSAPDTSSTPHDAARRHIAPSAPHIADAAQRSAAPSTPHDAAAANRNAWLSADEVLAALADPARRLIDARSAERYAGKVEPLDPIAGHVAGALNFPLTDNLDANGRFLSRSRLHELWLARLGGARAEDAVMMCGSGVTACHNILAVEHAGLGTAKLYAGSWSEWIKDPSRPIAKDPARPTPLPSEKG